MFRAFLVEDEAPARLRVKKLLSDYPVEIEIVGEADHGRMAISEIERLRPEVVFLDIQLPDMTGFSVLEKLSYQPLVIFTTGYEAFAIQAFETCSVDYLVKPFDADRFEKAIQKLRRFGTQKQNIDYKKLYQLLATQKAAAPTYSLPVKTKGRIILVEYEDIVYLKAEDKYVRVFTKNEKNYLSEQSLAKMEIRLPDDFIRVHRSFIINRSYIGEIRKFFKGKLILILKDNAQTSITTGSTYAGVVRTKLGF